MILAIACGGSDEETQKSGTLSFTLNAEDFVRDGFVSEDGWQIDFDHVYINVQGPTAFQVAETEAKLKDTPFKHAGHPHAEIPEGTAHVALTGAYFVDGHPGPDPIVIGQDAAAPIGNYNYINFNVVKASSESAGLVADYEGYSIVMIGTATKDDQSISFNIKLDEEIEYTSCGPHPESIGVVAENGKGEAQMTFHFDHIFGDFEEGPADTTDEDAINYVAVGFGPFAELATDGALDITQEDLKSIAVYDEFRYAMLTLGHNGEAHCNFEDQE